MPDRVLGVVQDDFYSHACLKRYYACMRSRIYYVLNFSKEIYNIKTFIPRESLSNLPCLLHELEELHKFRVEIYDTVLSFYICSSSAVASLMVAQSAAKLYHSKETFVIQVNALSRVQDASLYASRIFSNFLSFIAVLIK